MALKTSAIAAAIAITAVGIVAVSLRDQQTPRESATEIKTRSAANVTAPKGDEPRSGLAVHTKARAPSNEKSDVRVVRFPNGGQLEVRVRQRRRFDGPDRSIKLITQYEQLSQAALAGDAEAAFKLSQSLQACQHAYRNESDLERAIQRLYASSEIVPPDGRDPLPADPDHLSDIEKEVLRRPFEFCEGIQDEHLKKQDEWLAMAAEADLWPARVQYASGLGETHQAIAEWQRNWELGHVHALSWVDHIYRSGPDGEPADPATAYAYLYSDALLQFAYLRDDISPDASETRSHYEGLLVSRGAALSPRETQLAIAKAESMLRANSNCCYWP